MKKITEFFNKFYISNPPWEYNFLQDLDESDYPKYLAKLFYLKTGEKLPLFKEWNFKRYKGAVPSGKKLWNYIIDKNKCKTFNQKIQYIKLYGITNLMRDCTDKVKVRDYVREHIGAEYLKPALQIVRNEKLEVRSDNSISNSSLLTPNLFDKIDFEKLPDSFVIKCNHGCKWHYIIKNKEEYLKNKRLVEITRRNITGWLEQDYSLWGGFEMQYKGIKPKILIEPLLREDIDNDVEKLQLYCFNGIPKYIFRFYGNNTETVHNEHFQFVDKIFICKEQKIDIEVNENVKIAAKLSKELSKNFNFVRVDWMIFKNKLYFEELTFTPYSGMHKFTQKSYDEKFGSFINIEREHK